MDDGDSCFTLSRRIWPRLYKMADRVLKESWLGIRTEAMATRVLSDGRGRKSLVAESTAETGGKNV
jgi:hypothetical protein